MSCAAICPQLALTKVPDAALVDADGAIRLAIELGGLYSADYLQRFDRHQRRSAISYELW